MRVRHKSENTYFYEEFQAKTGMPLGIALIGDAIGNT